MPNIHKKTACCGAHKRWTQNSDYNLEQCFSNLVESPSCGRFWKTRGQKEQRGR